MRRRLQLTLVTAVAVASCRTDRPPPARAECTEPGEALLDELPEGALGRFPLDKEGCSFVERSVDAGVHRLANVGRFNGVWRVLYEELEGPGSVIEHSDGNADGKWDKRTVTTFADAGWEATEVEEYDSEGRADRRTRVTPIDGGRKRQVVEGRAPDGGWQTQEDFETSTRQR